MISLCKGLLITGLGIGAALASLGAQADGNGYVEAGLTQLTLSSGGYSVKPSNALVRVGYQFTRNFSAELLGAASVSSDTLAGASFKVDSAYGAYLKGQIEVAPKFELFARLGWLRATLTGSAPGISLTSSDSGVSYGVGAQYLFTNSWYLQGDYASYYDKNGGTIKGPSLGIGYRF